MKSLLLLLVGLLLAATLPVHAAAPISEKWAELRQQYDAHLILKDDPEAMFGRELLVGMWLAGASKGLAEVTRRSDGRQVAHLGVFWMSRLEGQDTLYGPALGINVGPAFHAFVAELPGLGELAQLQVPPFVSKLSAISSVEMYAGYRHVVSPDDHHFGYGFAFKIAIPINDILAYAKGSNGQKGL